MCVFFKCTFCIVLPTEEDSTANTEQSPYNSGGT